MSTARVSMRAMKALTSTSKTTTRPLSMTGSTTFSSLLTSDKPTGARSYPIRLRSDDTLPIPEINKDGKTARQFNTSRSMKAVNDSSTMDFMFIPEFDAETKGSGRAMRVPILPGTQASEKVKEAVTEAENPVFIPTISTASADGTHIHAPSAMSEMTNSDSVDFQGLASGVASTVASKVRERVEGEGMTKQILSDMWEDIVELAGKGGTAKA